MLRTIAECEAAIVECQQRLIALKFSLTEVQDWSESEKAYELMQVAKNTLRVLELELESLGRELIAARQREEPIA